MHVYIVFQVDILSANNKQVAETPYVPKYNIFIFSSSISGVCNISAQAFMFIFGKSNTSLLRLSIIIVLTNFFCWVLADLPVSDSVYERLIFLRSALVNLEIIILLIECGNI